MLDFKRVLASMPKKPEDVTLQPLLTPWGERIVKDTAHMPLHPHPHPQFQRESFISLDGWWDYAFEDCEEAREAWKYAAAPSNYEGHIHVPFSPESLLSGVERQLMPNQLLWYRRTFEAPQLDDSRLILHFEAVDYACSCSLNGVQIGQHAGGYLPFFYDITDYLAEVNELALCVYDPSDKGVQLRGKQKLEHGGIWYTAQSGIWQSVWLEVVPASHIKNVAIDANPDEGKLKLTFDLSCAKSETLIALLCEEEKIVASGKLVAHESGSHELILNVSNPHLWSTDDPFLYDLLFTFGQDKVKSYCAFRTVTMEQDSKGSMRLCVNHQPVFLRGLLDQGYWSDGLLTPPSDEALVYDIQVCKDLGFNMLRKHIKVECDRWYYHCDRLGMLVWQDMVQGGSPLSPWHSSYKPTLFSASWGACKDDTPKHHAYYSAESAEYQNEWTDTCIGTIEYLRNHPSVITWVLFNEAWGQFNARKATDMVRALDPTRPIDSVSGWYDQRCGDFLSVHNYFRPLEVMKDKAPYKRGFVISEFGGLSFHVEGHSSLETSYGYATYSDLTEFRTAVREALRSADALESQGLAGFVYTQVSDVEEETNGILTYDRRINKLQGACS